MRPKRNIQKRSIDNVVEPMMRRPITHTLTTPLGAVVAYLAKRRNEQHYVVIRKQGEGWTTKFRSGDCESTDLSRVANMGTETIAEPQALYKELDLHPDNVTINE